MDAASSEIIIHPPSGWFFIFGHSPCLLAAPEGASTVWHVRGAFYFTFVQSPLPVTCLRLFYLFLLFLRFLCYSFLAYQTYFLFGRPPFDVLDAVARPHPYSTSKGVFLSCPTAISASEPPAPSAGFSLYKKRTRLYSRARLECCVSLRERPGEHPARSGCQRRSERSAQRR